MDDRDVARHWDENAPEWIRAVRSGWDVYREYVNNPVFFRMLPDLAGQAVLDVGCGEGYNTRRLADIGAKMAGVDVSEAMVDAARQHEERETRGIEYHVASGSDLGRFADESFAAVVSTMAMMDLPDYEGCVAEVARVLEPGGLFQFSITHPCTMTRRFQWVRDDEGRRLGMMVGNYFGCEPTTPEQEVEQWFFGGAPPEVRAKARRFRVPRFFRTLSEYVNPLAARGFRILQIAEPMADDDAIRQCPDVEDTRIVPYFLVVQCRKEG